MNPMNVQLDIGGVWRLSIFVGLIFCSIVLMRFWKKILGWEAAVLWSYAIASAICVIEFPFVRFGDYQTAFMASSGQTLAEVLLVPLAIVMSSIKGLEALYRVFIALSIFEIGALWFHGCGLMMQTSFDSAFVAMFMPFMPALMWIVALVTVLTHHGSTALLIIMSQCIIWAIRNKKSIAIPIAVSAALVVVARFHNADLMLNGSDRIMAYKRFLTWWWSQGPITQLFGTGAGTFQWLSLMIDGFKEPMFIQMHSDWLQVLFELGIVGFALAFLVLIKAAKASWNNPRRLCSIFGLAAFALTYHPLRFFPSMLLSAYIIRIALISCK